LKKYFPLNGSRRWKIVTPQLALSFFGTNHILWLCYRLIRVPSERSSPADNHYGTPPKTFRLLFASQRANTTYFRGADALRGGQLCVRPRDCSAPHHTQQPSLSATPTILFFLASRVCYAAFVAEVILQGATTMEWVTPQHEEIDLNCEISSYANAEL
jgi:hypothetical protein